MVRDRIDMMARWLASALVAFAVIAACATAVQPSGVEAAYVWPTGWARDRSDLPSDPDYTLGTLPNGMRYLVLPNKSPPDQVAMRLVISAGSMQERPGEEGVAHFLEHLAFRGTTNFPDGELQRVLEGLGLQMGADANASTAQDHTTFMFNMARNDERSIGVGLKLFREIVSQMSMAPALVNAERGVVLAEERTRAGPEEEVSKAFMKLQVGDHPFARSPIGLRPVIEKVTPETIRTFYDAFYRPERATLIIVGDVTAAKVLPSITAEFGDWQGRGPAGADPQPVMKAPPNPDVVVQTTPGSTDASVMMSWFEPFRAEPPTKAEHRRRLVEDLGVTAINFRMQEFIDASGRPARYAGAPTPVRFANVWSGAIAQAAGVTDAPATLSVMTKAYRQAARFGITRDELDQMKAIRLASARQAAGAGRIGTSPDLADGLADQLADDPMFVSLGEDLRLTEELLPGITPADVNAAIEARLKAKPTIIYRGSAPPPGGEAGLRAAYAKASSAPLTAYVMEPVKAWPYADFGAPGKVVERKEVADLGVTMVRFENGVKLVVKPFDAIKDQIQVHVRLGLGRIGMPRDAIDASDMATTLWDTGGLGRLTATQQARTLSGKHVWVDASADDDAFLLDNRNATTREDFGLQMQLMTAMVNDPAYRPDQWASLLAEWDRADENLMLTAGGALQRDLDTMLHSGDIRWTINTKAQRDSWKPADTVAFMKPIVANSPIQVTIVGDIDVDTAIAQTSKTLGALPKRPELKEPPGLRNVKFPAAGDAVMTHKGRADQGYAMVAWPTQGFYRNMRDFRIGWVIGQMVRDNATRKFRSEGGATYSPEATVDFSRVLPDYGYIGVRVEVPPAMIDNVQAEMIAIASDLGAVPQVRSEIDRVVLPRIEQVRREMATNTTYWVQNLDEAWNNPAVLDVLRTQVSDYASITPADVQAAAKRWLKRDAAWKLRVQPEN